MHPLAAYNILFSGLKNGTHRFDYLIEHPFFEAMEFSPIKEGRVWINLELSKHETMMVFEFHIKGTVHTTCDRCLEEFDLPIEGQQKLIVKFGDTAFEETDEVVVIPRGEHEFNVAQYIYEFIMLLIPIKVAHPEDEDGNFTCDPSALDLLSSSEDDTAGEPETDPRWEALKKLKNKE